jgi:hypothetical protein
MSTFIKVLNYVEYSFGCKPAFIIEMSDGEYISNGCVFKKNTEENRKELSNHHGCKKELKELLKAPPIEMKELTDGRSMFEGCLGLTKWTQPLPELVNGNYMFYHSKFTKWTQPLPKLVDGNYMFYHSKFTKWIIGLPKLVNGNSTFYYSKFKQWDNELPELINGNSMFRASKFTEWNIELPELIHDDYMFHKSSF